MKKKIIKALVVVSRKSGELKIAKMGTNENPYYSIHPTTKVGRNYAEDNCNGYETVVECDLIVASPKKHECNCRHCIIKDN